MHLSGITWVMVIAAAVWAMLLARTFQIQIVDGEKYRQIASNRAQDRTIRVAPRGRILDRNGNVLAQSIQERNKDCLLYTSPSPRDRTRSRMPSSA